MRAVYFLIWKWDAEHVRGTALVRVQPHVSGHNSAHRTKPLQPSAVSTDNISNGFCSKKIKRPRINAAETQMSVLAVCAVEAWLQDLQCCVGNYRGGGGVMTAAAPGDVVRVTVEAGKSPIWHRCHTSALAPCTYTNLHTHTHTCTDMQYI